MNYKKQLQRTKDSLFYFGISNSILDTRGSHSEETPADIFRNHGEFYTHRRIAI